MNWFDKFFLKITLGEIIKDYGVFSSQTYLSTFQELSLFKCKKKDQIFYVIKAHTRSQSTALLGFNTSYLKVSKDELDKLHSLLSKKVLYKK